MGPTSTGAPQVIASVSPVPVPMRAQSSPPSRYQIIGEVTFRDVSGIGGRLTQMTVAVVAASGEEYPQRVTIDLALPAGGTVKQQISESMTVSAGQPPYQLRLEAGGVDQTGKAFGVPALSVPMALSTGSDGGSPAPDAVFVGAGDIAVCGSQTTEATARLLDRSPGSVFALGDHVYPNGTAERFASCYEPTWGRHRSRTNPAPGNHDWDVDAAAPYFAYFGTAAGPAGQGYYSFNLGGWHVLSLNSNVPAGPGSAQYEWARVDLAAARTSCTLAYWHHPLFSSGPNGNNGQMREMWRLLQASGGDVVLSAHDHEYERFTPQDAEGRPDPRGIREFVVGTGGAPLYSPKSIQPNSEVRESQTWGVLRLTLRARSYDWEFVPIDGQAFRDGGTASCTP
jgi:hypothetical protein